MAYLCTWRRLANGRNEYYSQSVEDDPARALVRKLEAQAHAVANMPHLVASEHVLICAVPLDDETGAKLTPLFDRLGW